ncbi:putative diguanylate cyclase YfiN [compost metagenome]
MDLVCRLGGDEFAILLAPVQHESEVREVMLRIQQAMVAPVVLGDGHHLVAGISVGYAMYPEQGLTADELLQYADSDMYQAKRQRREGITGKQTKN